MSGTPKDARDSIEYFVPELGLELEPYLTIEDTQGIHHLARYHWAVRVLEPLAPRRILDVACGAGYGSYLLAERLGQSTVLGVDYDRRAVEFARASYSRPRLAFARGNLVTWELEDGEGGPLGLHDAILSFDTIEHLLHREIALLRIAENLADGGCFLISTPCYEVTRLGPAWEHHKIEYGFGDLRKLLQRFFGTVRIPEDGSLPGLDYWNDVINRDKPRYLNRMNPVYCADPIR